MAISRMQNAQQLQGIGSLRQPYGLGKLVKKAFKGVKKIAKSPIGKAALVGGLGMIPFGGQSTWGRLGGMLANRGVTGGGIGNFFNKSWGKYLNPMSGAFGPKNKWKHALGLAGVGAIAAPFIQKGLGFGPYEEEEVEEDDWTVTPGSIANIRNMAVNQDPSLAFLPSSNYVQSGFYAADGGRAGLLNGGEAGKGQMEQMLRAEYLKYRNQGGTMPYEQFKILVMKQAQQGQVPNQMMAANGGRIGYNRGRVVHPGGYAGFEDDESKLSILWETLKDKVHPEHWGDLLEFLSGQTGELPGLESFTTRADGGRIGAQEGGLMDMGGQEKDYRDEGGFVPIGGEERADDVPARLSKNEFVFTADAVRAAGGGDIDKGSEVMQNVMDNLEQGGEVSEDSQGLQGGEEIMSEEIIDESNPAQGMYDNYEQLQSRVV